MTPTDVRKGSFGISLAVDGDWLLAGSSQKFADFYHFEAGNWVFKQEVTSSNVNPISKSNNTWFGFSVALHRELAILSEPLFTPSLPSSLGALFAGQAVVYQLNGDSWAPIQSVGPRTSDPFELFGSDFQRGVGLAGSFAAFGTNVSPSRQLGVPSAKIPGTVLIYNTDPLGDDNCQGNEASENSSYQLGKPQTDHSEGTRAAFSRVQR